ncbi:MAG: glycosyltransferase family 4 protein [Victivallales bacterium]
MKKMLIIAPMYPFPCKCGMTVRIGDMCNNIADSVELHIYACDDSFDNATIEHEDLFKSISFPRKNIKKGFLNKIIPRLKRKIIKPYFDDSLYIADYILEDLSLLHKKYGFETVMIHTPTLARCLNAFPDEVYKIVDSIDIWHQRYLDFCRIGQGKVLSHFRNLELELSLYKSADLVLAISLWDRDYLISHGLNPIYVPVSFKPDPLLAKTPAGFDVLYASGNGYANIDAVHFFMDEILPIVKLSLPDVKLLVPNACDVLKKDYSQDPNIRMLPFYEDIKDAYKLADLVVVPLRAGSGLKIKVLESFSFGCPTILSNVAAQGISLQAYAQKDFPSNPVLFASEVVTAFKDREYRDSLSNSGIEIIRKEYNSAKVYQELKNKISFE